MKFVFRYTARFLRNAKGILSEDDLIALEVFLAANPNAGDVIQGSGGLRKLRFAAKGHGKRGGARVIYLRIAHPSTIVLSDCYAKNAKTDLSPSETRTLEQEAKE